MTENSSLASPFTRPLATPYYPDVTLYSIDPGTLARGWEYSGWQAESMSWKTGCYIHAGLSGRMKHTFEGPQALAFVRGLCINGFEKFPAGSSKHAIMLNDRGLVATHGVLQREEENRFSFFGFGGWLRYQHARTKLDVTMTTHDIYNFQIGGPTSLQTIERAAGQSLRDLAFLRFRPLHIGDTAGEIAGLTTEVCRVGMTGTLSYELRGPLEDGPKVYDAVFRAGADYGIERLGWRTYHVNHVEGGFPQNNWTFIVAIEDDPGFKEHDGGRFASYRTGSVDPTDLRSRQRTPVEVGWQSAARFDHDFVGRQALEAEMASPKRTIVTLRWNAEDVMDIYASLLRPGESFLQLDLPTTPFQKRHLAHADHVFRGDKAVGISSGTIYSYFFREVLSHCTIDHDCAEIGTEVVVHWGTHGRAIKCVRATVERYPYLQAQRNRDVDLSEIPSGVAGAAFC